MIRRQLDQCGEGLWARNHRAISKDSNSRIFVGNGVIIDRDVKLWLSRGSSLYIGDNSYLANGALILSQQEVRIGKDCSISWHTLIMDSSSYQIGYGDEEPEIRVAPVLIGDHVWIGCRAVILKGVSVGDGAVVANNAVVTRDVPPGVMVAGNPAHVVRENVVWK
ncbi:MAG: acyltransferase [Syntrophomonadaceae bacterium]|nr:acyltransferase [Syntrophomonadaceae bacterium]